MAAQGAQVSVSTSATELTGTQTDAAAGQVLLVTNRGTASVYLGASDVNTSTGYRLDPGEAISADLGQGEQLYGIVATGTQTCHVLRTGV